MPDLCGKFEDHEAHDDCPGGVKCQYCPSLLRRDLAVVHLQQVHADKLEPYRGAVAEALQKAAEESGVPLALVRSERVSGPPSGAPATHTGRPAQHSGVTHAMDSTAFAMPLGAPKCPKGGCELTHPHLHTAAEMTEGDPLDNYCDHPNGFGVNGCPCGASKPDDDEAEATFRNIDTGVDERGIRCPVTLDCMHGVWPESQIRKHVMGEHGWSADRFENWAESINLQDLPLIPAPLAEDMAARVARQAEIDNFLNPQVTLENLVNMVTDQSIENVLTEWWLARAEEEASAVVPKAIAYGSNSLMQLGRKMAQLQGREVSDEEALELGCWANLVQKVERMTDSVMRGERCADDTVYDIGVYIKMVQRIRDAGSWPGV